MVVTAGLVSLFVLVIVTQFYGDRTYQTATIIGFLGHIFVTLVIVPIVPYGWDIQKFHHVGATLIGGEIPAASTTVTSFGTFQALLYTFFPAQPETVGVFNGLFAVLLFIPIAYLVKQLYPNLPGTPHGSMMLILFLPLQFYLLSIPMRDSLSVLLFFSILALGHYCLSNRNSILALTLPPLWGMMFLLRRELGMIAFLGLGAATAIEALQATDRDLSISSLTAVLGGIGAVGFGLFAEFLYPLSVVNRSVDYRARGGAAYLEGMQYSSWFDFLLVAPTRAIYFQFAPFPLHVESVFHLLTFTATPIAIVLFVSAARSLYECEYDETTAALLVVVYVAGITGYGVIDSNFGTNVRHRIVFDFLLIVLAAPVVERWALRVREWLGVVPGDRGGDHEQQQEAQELDSHVNVGGQYADDAQ
ncbi:hypothetical protein ACFQDG_00985 [Natronoarchaeum mannanilyticum]|uniref:Glycosyltransferase RgtA/B/C/D-like domain-containing protein n=1 Tax=Natronoarchaeum mannanilyticum TaxID=926360 RepID=A0AAV3T8E3_9EURY